MRIIGSSAMSKDVLWRVSGPALGCRNRLSLRSGPATSLLAQNRAKSGDSWASRAGRAVQAGSSRCTVIAARYMATCLAASCSQSAIRVRQRGCTGVVLPATGLVFGVAGEREQVLALVGIQPKRIRNRGQHTGRRPGLAALLQPRVPGQTDVGELGDPSRRRPGT